MLVGATFCSPAASYYKTNIMKRIAYSIFAAVLLVAGTLKATAQSQETRQVSGYNSLSSSGPFNVHIKIDGTESLKISASSEVISKIETTVEDGKLQIKLKRHTPWTNDDNGRIDIYVTAKLLGSLVNAGSGSVDVESGILSGSKVNVVLSGSGSINTAVKSDDLHAVLSGSGSVHIKGHSDEATIAISGSGEVKGKELKTNDASVTITGSGNAYISADKTVSARIIGSGNIVYSGNASVDSKTIGSGRVSKEN